MSDLYEEIHSKLPASQKTYERNNRYLAQEVVGTVFLPYAFYVEDGEGARVRDVDGNSYIDLTMGFGPLLLGHNHEVPRAALEEGTMENLPSSVVDWDRIAALERKVERLERLLSAQDP